MNIKTMCIVMCVVSASTAAIAIFMMVHGYPHPPGFLPPIRAFASSRNVV